MGYSTAFIGRIEIDPPLNESERTFLQGFAESLFEPVPGSAHAFQRKPSGPGEPDGHCAWTVTDDGTAIVWNEDEKFHDAVEWMVYWIHHFLSPGGKALHGGEECFRAFTFDHACQGTLAAIGEEEFDYWLLHVRQDEVTREPVCAAGIVDLNDEALAPLEEEGLLLVDTLDEPGPDRERSVRETLAAVEYGDPANLVDGLRRLAEGLREGEDFVRFLDSLGFPAPRAAPESDPMFRPGFRQESLGDEP